MADYGQPLAVTKRVRFFDGQYLQDQDFVDEQKYQLDRTRRLGRLLGFTGIAEGLVVSEVAGKPFSLKVSAGTAVDSLGRQLVLPTETTLTLPDDRFARQQNVAVLIAFRETESDVAQTGGRSARRFDETPVVAAVTTGGAVAVAPPDASTTLDKVTVPLATVTVNDTGAVVVSREAGRPAGLSIGSLTTTGSVGIGTAEPRARLEVAGGLGGTSIDLVVSGRLQSATDDGGLWVNTDRFIGGKGKLVGFFNATADWGLVMTPRGDVGIGTTSPENAEGWGRALDVYNDSNAKLSVRNKDVDARVVAHPGWWGAPAGMVVGTKGAHAVSLATGAAARLTVSPTGNVGIGTTTPENAEGWERAVDVLSGASTKVSVRTTTGNVDGRIAAHTGGIYGQPAATMLVGTRSNHPLTMVTGAQTRAVITEAGAVGIGTPRPGAKLEVAGTGGMTVDLLVNGRLKSNSNDGGLWISSNRFVGGTGTLIGFFQEGPGWGLVMEPTGDVAVTTGNLTVQKGRLKVPTAEVTGDAAVGGSLRIAREVEAAGLLRSPACDFGRVVVSGQCSVNAGLTVKGDVSLANGLTAGGLVYVNELQASGLVRVFGDLLALRNLAVGAERPDNAEGWARVLDVAGGDHSKLSVRTTTPTPGGTPIDGRVAAHSGGIYGARPGMVVGTRSDHDVTFVTNGQNRMYIRNDGRIYCNGLLYFPVSSFSNWGMEDRFGPRTEYYWTLGRWNWNTNNREPGDAILGYAEPRPSDLRLKDDVAELTAAVDRIEQLRGVTFTWNAEGKRYLTNFVDDSVSAGPDASEEADRAAREDVRKVFYPGLSRPTIGIIAQEVEAVLPELVSAGEDGIKKVDYTKLTAVLVQAVKEQQAEIRALTGRLDALASPDAPGLPGGTHPTDPMEK